LIHDLAASQGQKTSSATVCIVGAGIAGLILAARLRRNGVSVALLESGPIDPEDLDPLNDVELTGQEYDGALRGRSRGLGGNSRRWGGQLFPIREEALSPRPALNAPGWPVTLSEIENYLPEIEAIFGLPPGPYEDSRQGSDKAPDIQVAHSKVPSFKNRNVAWLFRDSIKSDPQMEIWVNATVVGLDLNRETGRLQSVTARHENSASVTLQADFFVLASGTIETTRLLLALDAEHDHKPFAGCEALGRYFGDHISLPLAEVLPSSRGSRQQLNAMFAHGFAPASTLRSTRLELSSSAQAADNVACAYGHISMEVAPDSGFAMLRDFLLMRQGSGTSRDPRQILKMLKVAPYLAMVGYRRYIDKYLQWQPDAKLHLHVVVEQAPDAANCISLSDKRDMLGNRVPSIEWRMRDPDIRTFQSYMRHFDAYWIRQGLAALGRLDWRRTPEALDATAIAQFGAGDIFHPAGSTRMGTDQRTAVVDRDLKTFAVSNLWVGSASVFPTMSSANPTLTLMLLMLRLGDHLAKLRKP
jgi:choline dehydrogenase-like flavoprotein